LTAKIFHHELDHMNGITFTTKVHPINLDKAKRHVKKNLKMLKAQYEQMEKQAIINQAINNIAEQNKQKTMVDEILTEIPENLTIKM